MGCAAVDPSLTPRDQARFLNDHIPAGLFGGVGVGAERVAWRLSPEPFRLSPATLAAIERLGPDLLRFSRVLASLYKRSARGTAPAFIADYLDRGKPEAIVRLGRQNRFKSDVPGIIRPDLILTEDGFIAAELDSVPGGMGFVGAMAQAYCELGFDTVGERDGIARGFAAMLASVAGQGAPATAIVVSEESEDYFAELHWLAEAVTAAGLGETHACKPEQIVFTEEALFVRLPDGREEKLDVLYRNFELFDLLNVPKQELMLYAARHNRVKMTPPPKAQLEEKLAFALLHHPGARDALARGARRRGFERLRALFPQTWVLDPRPLPPQAAIVGPDAPAATPVHDWMQLDAARQERARLRRQAVGLLRARLGLARRARSPTISRARNGRPRLREGLAAFDRTPHICSASTKGSACACRYFDRAKERRRCRWTGACACRRTYFVAGESVRLGGILATIAPADKRLIHGMTDAIMAPCAPFEGGY